MWKDVVYRIGLLINQIGEVTECESRELKWLNSHAGHQAENVKVKGIHIIQHHRDSKL